MLLVLLFQQCFAEPAWFKSRLLGDGDVLEFYPAVGAIVLLTFRQMKDAGGSVGMDQEPAPLPFCVRVRRCLTRAPSGQHPSKPDNGLIGERTKIPLEEPGGIYLQSLRNQRFFLFHPSEDKNGKGQEQNVRQPHAEDQGQCARFTHYPGGGKGNI